MSEADVELDRTAYYQDLVKMEEQAEPTTVTRATSSSLAYLGPTFAAEIKVLNEKEQLLVRCT